MQEVKEGLKLDNLRTNHVMIRSELQYLIGAKIVDLKCRVFGGKTAPCRTVRVFRVVRPIARVQFQVEPNPEPTREFGPVAITRVEDPPQRFGSKTNGGHTHRTSRDRIRTQGVNREERSSSTTPNVAGGGLSQFTSHHSADSSLRARSVTAAGRCRNAQISELFSSDKCD
jgi:hypothetical protein